MQEASDRLEFETAALIRDQIAAITKVTAGQKVVVDPDVEMDVVALAGTPGSVCAAVLRFREERLTDKREFLFHDTADIAAVREEFLPRYYLDDEQIPKVIAVDELPPDADALAAGPQRKRGSEVQLYVPSGAIRRTSSRWPTPTPSSGWPGERPLCPGGKASG